jgi:hypothetical protein
VTRNVGCVSGDSRVGGVRLCGRRVAVVYGCGDDVTALRHGGCGGCGGCGVVRGIEAVDCIRRLCWLRHGDLALKDAGREVLKIPRLFWSRALAGAFASLQERSARCRGESKCELHSTG